MNPPYLFANLTHPLKRITTANPPPKAPRIDAHSSTPSSIATANFSSAPTAPVRVPFSPFSPFHPPIYTTNHLPAHDISAKKGKGNTAAGVFTQPYAIGYVLTALEEAIARGDISSDSVTDAALAGFLSEHGRAFYGINKASQNILLTRGGQVIPESLKGEGAEIVPFRAGETTWSVEWQ